MNLFGLKLKPMSIPINRGDIFEIDLEPVKGSEQGRRRPCVVVQNDIGNKFSPVIIIVTCTKLRGDARIYPTDVIITADETGLPTNSKVLCNQIRTVDKSRIIQKMGTVPAEKMEEIDKALKISLGLVPI